MVRIAWCRVKLLPSIVLSLVLLGCGDLWMQKKPVLPVVQSLDLERYLGKWYEIARYPNSFQKGCVATTANYSMLEDGEIRVLNECRQGSLDGPAKRAEAKAWVVDPSTKAKLTGLRVRRRGSSFAQVPLDFEPHSGHAS
jgi:apolipoprotein D and lipocalin family protein